MSLIQNFSEFSIKPKGPFFIQMGCAVLEKSFRNKTFAIGKECGIADPGVFKAYKNYLEGFTQEDQQYHILSQLRTVYSWKLFSDSAHLNKKGTLRFNREFAKILNKAHVPGGPYGVSSH